MEKPNNKERSQLTLIAIVLMSSIALVWSAGLIVRGIWQLSRQSNIQASRNGKPIPDFASVPNVTTGVFNYGGSTAWASLRLAVDSVIQSERPELQLRYVQPQNEPPGSSPGIKMLLKGRVDFIQSSRPLRREEYKLAKQKGFKLEQVPVAVDSIVVTVHPELDIPGLTLSQLQAIYTGKISNWRELGGADLAITPYSRPPSTGGMVDSFSNRVLQNRDFGSNVEFVSTTTQALRQLANDPGGIYYGSASAIVTQCTAKPLPLGLQEDNPIAPYQQPLVPAAKCPPQRNKLNVKALRTARYPLTHYLYVVFLQDRERSHIGRAYANFLLTPQGQKLITKAGFIPLD